MSRPRVDPNAVIAAYAKDRNIHRVGKQFSCSGTWVSEILQKHGISRGGTYVLSDQGRRSMIAKKRGKRCSPATEFKKGRSINLGMRKYDPKEIVKTYKRTQIINGTARALGISSKTIKTYLNEARVKRLPVPKRAYSSNFQGKTDPNRNRKDKVACKCGCGTMIYRYKSNGRERNFVHGHNAVGSNNNQWQGGISRKPYPFDWSEKLKAAIRQRDNYRCRVCNKSQKKNVRKLSVHHIDYDKENLDPQNLVSLCDSCHGKTMTNRRHWTRYFQNITKVRSA